MQTIKANITANFSIFSTIRRHFLSRPTNHSTVFLCSVTPEQAREYAERLIHLVAFARGKPCLPPSQKGGPNAPT